MFGKKLIRYSMMAAMLGAPVVVLADDTMAGKQDQKAIMNKDAVRQAMLARASKVIGTNVTNDAGESLGEINELVLDGGENRIGYAVLSYGGVLGIGDKLFAIPWNQFEQKGTDKNKLYLNTSKETLRSAPGFDQKKWPDAADRTYWESVDKHYPKQASNNDTSMRTDPAATPNGTAPQHDTSVTDANRTNTNTPMEKGIAWSRKVSSVIGADVQNASAENLGDVKDLVIDTTTGRVRYAVISFGGWLGIGDKLFAVPMSSLQGASGREYFVMNVTKEQMKNAPGFEDKAWPDFASPEWNTIDSFYGVKDGSQAALTK